MKRLYHVNLDEEKVAPVKEWLSKNGMSFSGYINVIVGEIYATIGKIETGKKTSIRQCAELFADTVEQLDEVKETMKDKKISKVKVKER